MEQFLIPKCPICDLAMTAEFNRDVYLCPKHGAITGLLMLQMGKLRGAAAEKYIAEARASDLPSAS